MMGGNHSKGEGPGDLSNEERQGLGLAIAPFMPVTFRNCTAYPPLHRSFPPQRRGGARESYSPPSSCVFNSNEGPPYLFLSHPCSAPWLA